MANWWSSRWRTAALEFRQPISNTCSKDSGSPGRTTIVALAWVFPSPRDWSRRMVGPCPSAAPLEQAPLFPSRCRRRSRSETINAFGEIMTTTLARKKRQDSHHLSSARFADKPEDFAKLRIQPGRIEAFEDGM